MTQLAWHPSSFSVKFLQQSLTRQEEGSNVARIANVQSAVIYPFVHPNQWIKQGSAFHLGEYEGSQRQILPSDAQTALDSEIHHMIDDQAVVTFKKSLLIAATGIGLSFVGDPFGLVLLPTIGAAMLAAGCLLASGVVEKSRDGE